MYKKILVPLDGSELAEKVLPYAIQLTFEVSSRDCIASCICGW